MRLNRDTGVWMCSSVAVWERSDGWQNRKCPPRMEDGHSGTSKLVEPSCRFRIAAGFAIPPAAVKTRSSRSEADACGALGGIIQGIACAFQFQGDLGWRSSVLPAPRVIPDAQVDCALPSALLFSFRSAQRIGERGMRRQSSAGQSCHARKKARPRDEGGPLVQRADLPPTAG